MSNFVQLFIYRNNGYDRKKIITRANNLIKEHKKHIQTFCKNITTYLKKELAGVFHCYSLYND